MSSERNKSLVRPLTKESHDVLEGLQWELRARIPDYVPFAELKFFMLFNHLLKDKTAEQRKAIIFPLPENHDQHHRVTPRLLSAVHDVNNKRDYVTLLFIDDENEVTDQRNVFKSRVTDEEKRQYFNKKPLRIRLGAAPYQAASKSELNAAAAALPTELFLSGLEPRGFSLYPDQPTDSPVTLAPQPPKQHQPGGMAPSLQAALHRSLHPIVASGDTAAQH